MKHPGTPIVENALKDIYILFDEVPFAVAALKGPELIIEYINRYNLNIWGQSREEVLGKPLFDVRPDIKRAAVSIHEEIYRTGKRYETKELPIKIMVNGKEDLRYFNTTIDPMKDRGGKIIGQLAVSIDVTEQVLARKKIEESEERYALTINATNLGIWDFDVKNQVVVGSGKIAAIYGLDSNEEYNLNVALSSIYPADKKRTGCVI